MPSCLVSRTLSIACHGYRVSWLLHHCFPCIYFSLLLIAFSEYLFLQSKLLCFQSNFCKSSKQGFTLGFFVLFCLFCLGVWGAYRWSREGEGLGAHKWAREVWFKIKYFVHRCALALQVLKHKLPYYQIKTCRSIMNGLKRSSYVWKQAPTTLCAGALIMWTWGKKGSTLF